MSRRHVSSFGEWDEYSAKGGDQAVKFRFKQVCDFLSEEYMST